MYRTLDKAYVWSGVVVMISAGCAAAMLFPIPTTPGRELGAIIGIFWLPFLVLAMLGNLTSVAGAAVLLVGEPQVSSVSKKMLQGYLAVSGLLWAAGAGVMWMRPEYFRLL